MDKIFFIALWFVWCQAFAQNASQIVQGTYAPGLLAAKNYIKNPDCAKNTVGITASGGSLTRGTTTPLNEDTGTECVIDASSSGQTYTWALNTLGQGLKGRNCEANFTYEGDASLYKAYIKQGSTQVTSDLQLAYPTASKSQSINFPCGDLSTATTFVVESTSASAAAFSAAKVYVGEATNLGSVAQATFYGSWEMTGATSCSWGTTSTTPTNFSADTDCNAPTVTGGVTANASKIPGFDLNNAPPGNFFVKASVINLRGGSTGNAIYSRLSDGTSFGTTGMFYSAATSDGDTTNDVSTTFSYTVAGNHTVQVQGWTGNASATISLYYAQTDLKLRFEVFYFPTSSQLALNSNLPSYPTIQTFTSGSGTYTKPAGVQYIRVRMVGAGGGGGGSGVGAGTGGTGGNTTFGTSLLVANGGTGGVGQGGLPGSGGSASLGTGPIGLALSGGNGQRAGNANGTAVVDAPGNGGTTIFGGVGAANTGAGGVGALGTGLTTDAGGSGGGSGGYVEAIIGSPSATYSYAVGSGGSAGSAGTSGAGGSAGRDGLIEVTEYYSTVPAPLLVGSVTSNTSGTERIERVRINIASSSSCSITSQTGSWVSSCAASSGIQTITLPVGTFSSAPTCIGTCDPLTTGKCVVRMNGVGTSTSQSFLVVDASTGIGSSPENANIICMGPR